MSGEFRHILEDSTQEFFFNTVRFASGAPFTLAGTPSIYARVDGGATELTTGITLSVDFDSKTGSHKVSWDSSASASYAAGAVVTFFINAGTVDGVSVVGLQIGPTYQINASGNLSSLITRGLLALPSAAPDAAGGLPVSDAGGLDLDTLLGRLDAAITTRQATIWSSPSATVNLSGTTVKAVTDRVTANADQISGSAAAADNMEVVFATDFGSNYDTTNDAWRVRHAGTLATLDALDTAQDAQHASTQAAIAGLDIPTAAEIVNEWESQSQADPTGFHVNVMELRGGQQSAIDLQDFADEGYDPTFNRVNADVVSWQQQTALVNADFHPIVHAATLGLNAVDNDALGATAVAEITQGLLLAGEGGGLTVGSTGNDATHVHLPLLSHGDDELNDQLLVIYDASEFEYHQRWIEDWDNTSRLATVAALPFTPQGGTDKCWIRAARRDVAASGGGSADWTTTEKQHIRHRLGIDGSAAAPTAAPSLALEATAQAAKANTDYPDGWVLCSPATGTAGTTVGTHGTQANPANTWNNAVALATALGTRRIRYADQLLAGGPITADASSHVIDFNHAARADLWDETWITNHQYAVFLNGNFGAGVSSVLHLRQCHLMHCSTYNDIAIYSDEYAILDYHRFYVTTVTFEENAGADVWFVWYGCWVYAAVDTDGGVLTLDFQNGGSGLWLQDFHGDVKLLNMSSGQRFKLYGWSRLIIADSCTGGTIWITSHVQALDENGDPWVNGAGKPTVILVSEPGAVGSFTAAAQAEIQQECTDALVAHHLDHLLAAAYDPASKPGHAAGLLNVLMENDAGVPRYTANALERAPSGGGGGGGPIIITPVTSTVSAGAVSEGHFEAYTDAADTVDLLHVDSSGNAIDLTGVDLDFIVERRDNRADKFVKQSPDDVTGGDGVTTVTWDAGDFTAPGVWAYALRQRDTGKVWARGTVSVEWAAAIDA